MVLAVLLLGRGDWRDQLYHANYIGRVKRFSFLGAFLGILLSLPLSCTTVCCFLKQYKSKLSTVTCMHRSTIYIPEAVLVWIEYLLT